MCIHCLHSIFPHVVYIFTYIESVSLLAFIWVYIALPVVSIRPNENITIPEEGNVTLRCEATGEGTFNYQWIRVSQPSSEVDLKNKETYLIIFNVTVNDTGEYFCKVDNGGTSVSSVGVQVIVKSKLLIN